MEQKQKKILDIIFTDYSKMRLLLQMRADVKFEIFTIDEVLDSSPNPIYYGLETEKVDVILFKKIARGEEREILKNILSDSNLIDSCVKESKFYKKCRECENYKIMNLNHILCKKCDKERLKNGSIRCPYCKKGRCGRCNCDYEDGRYASRCTYCFENGYDLYYCDVCI